MHTHREYPRYRGRFAPSPTGPLHLGSLFTAVASYLQAKSQDGTWLVRIDDLDPYRCKPVYNDQILETLQQFGLVWDETIMYQSQRHEAYKYALNQLNSKELLYHCDCSRRALQSRPDTQSGMRYDGYCRSRGLSSDDTAIRIRAPDLAYTCQDLIQVPLTQNIQKDIGDFIVFRRDHVFAYHLAVVVDDAEQEITEVFRGFDLLESTPRQIFLQKCLGITSPKYAHIPVIVDHEGFKLSKQAFAEDVSNMPIEQTLYRILNWLGQQPPEELKQSDTQTMLSWGVENWRFDQIPRREAIEVMAGLELQ